MMAQVRIAAVYRLLLLYVEPFMAFQGAVMAAVTPVRYLEVMSPHARGYYHPGLQVIFDQLAATYFLFAFNQAVVLRAAENSLRVWRALILGMLLCDFIHMYGTAKALGWESQIDPMTWRWEDWVNIAVLYGMSAVRISFLMGIGVKDQDEAKTKAKTG